MSLLDGAGATPDTGAKTPPAAEGAGTTPPAGSATPPASETPSGDWYYADNIKGEGARPEWLKDKYKTAADQAKAYTEIEKKLGAFKGAPDEYSLALESHPEFKFSNEDPLIKNFLESAKKNGVSQEYVTELLGVYAQALTYNIPDSDAEMKKIGVNAQQDLQILGQWAGDILSADEFNIFKSMITTSDAYTVFNKLRNAGVVAEVAEGTPRVEHESSQQVLQMMNDPRYETDENFRNEMRSKLSVAMAREGGKK